MHKVKRDPDPSALTSTERRILELLRQRCTDGRGEVSAEEIAAHLWPEPLPPRVNPLRRGRQPENGRIGAAMKSVSRLVRLGLVFRIRDSRRFHVSAIGLLQLSAAEGTVASC